MKKKSLRQQIAEEYEDIPLLFMDPKDYDVAIIGVSVGNGIEPKVAYDYEKVIDINAKDGGTREDAIEYFEYNQLGAYVGENTPIFIKKIKNTKGKL